MDYLDEISVEELQDALDDVDGNKPTQRLLAAIAYKNGVTQTELAEWYDTNRRTIYNWLMRFDTDKPIEQAVFDDNRSKKGRKPSHSRQKEFEQIVHEPPEEVGINAPVWTVMASSLDSSSTSPLNTQNISFLHYAKNSKMTRWLC